MAESPGPHREDDDRGGGLGCQGAAAVERRGGSGGTASLETRGPTSRGGDGQRWPMLAREFGNEEVTSGLGREWREQSQVTGRAPAERRADSKPGEDVALG